MTRPYELAIKLKISTSTLYRKLKSNDNLRHLVGSKEKRIRFYTDIDIQLILSQWNNA